MAAPSGVTPKDKYVVLSLTATGTIITEKGYSMGTVEAVGANVTKCSVGEIVLFKGINTFTIDSYEWVNAHEDDIYFNYVAP